MRYCVLGAGGCGGSIAGFMAAGGKDVALIARGAHLKAIEEQGLTLETTSRGRFTVPVSVWDAEEYQEHPDVIFVCVKEYSLDQVIPFLRRVGEKGTVVIPILNIYGTGERLQKELPEMLVTDGCIYVAAHRSKPGEIIQSGDIFRIVFGVRDPEQVTDAAARILFQTAEDLRDSGILVTVSSDIKRDTLQKYSLISPMAACGLYYDARVGAMQRAGEIRLLFEDLVKEIDELATAMGHPLLENAVKTNLDIIDGMSPDAAASVQRDVWEGKPSEVRGLVVSPITMGEVVGLPMEKYRMVAKKLGLL